MSDSKEYMPASDQTPNDGLDTFRQQIDAIDRKLVTMLNERANVVVKIGAFKQTSGGPIYVPHRERQVINRAIDANPGPLSDRTIEGIYRELMSGSFQLELPLRVGFLGPPGSFSHVAAARHFGSSVEHADMTEIDQVFEAVEAGHCQYGLVPYENSIGGGITDTLDAFQQREVIVYAEALIEVTHTLLCNGTLGEIKRVYSKPQAFAQCRRWLAANLPHAEQISMASTSAAARHAADEVGAAAVGSDLAGEIYNIKPLVRHVEDKKTNITRFLVIGQDEAQPSGEDKISMMFATAHKPGALVDVLGVFRDAGINLSHIEKRPSGKANWEYTFFIDCDGHGHDANMQAAIEEARTHCLSLKVLGSYPRAQRVL